MNNRLRNTKIRDTHKHLNGLLVSSFTLMLSSHFQSIMRFISLSRQVHLADGQNSRIYATAFMPAKIEEKVDNNEDKISAKSFVCENL